jgi:phospholipid transport system substrate-binding protein
LSATRQGTRRYGLALALIVAGGTARAEAPTAFIESAAAELATAVAEAGPGLRDDPTQQAAIIDSVLRPRFDLETSSRLVLRAHWNAASPAQRHEFVAAFYGYLVRSHGAAISWFRADSIVLQPRQPELLGDRYRVQTVLTMHDGETFQLQFYLRRRGDSWAVVDIIVDGVSYVRVYRSDLGSLARQDGLDGLIAWLETAAE